MCSNPDGSESGFTYKAGLMPLSSLFNVISRCHFVSNHFPRIPDDADGHHDLTSPAPLINIIININVNMNINIIIPSHRFWLMNQMMGIECQNLPFLECFSLLLSRRKLFAWCSFLHTLRVTTLTFRALCYVGTIWPLFFCFCDMLTKSY